ncbi:MAG: leucine-rich repeat domain-containing protein [Christensenellaceae bacterium]
MKRNLKTIFLIICFCLFAASLIACDKTANTDKSSASPADVENVNESEPIFDGDQANFYYEFFDENANALTVTGYKGSSSNVEIPARGVIDGVSYPVKAIKEKAFSRNGTFVNVRIADGVEFIGERAFLWCQGIKTLVVPDSVTNIGFGAFNGCSSLVEITLPFVGNNRDESLNSHFGYVFAAESHEDNAGYTPNTLKTVNVTDATFIGDYAFNSMRKLKNVNLNEGITKIGQRAFFWCEGLEELTIPKSVVEYGDSSLNGCSHLVKLSVPFLGDKKSSPTCTNIGYLFGANDGKNNAGVMPSTLREVELTNETKICTNAFYGLKKLEKIVFCDYINEVEDNAFDGCKSLKFNESDNVGYLGSNLKPFMLAMTVYDKTATEINVHPATVSIYSGALSECVNLQTFTVPEGVQNIATRAFYKNLSLKTVNVSDSVSKIGDYAFYGCPSLKNVNIGNDSHLVSIGQYAFYDCSSLESFTFSKGIQKVGESAFLGCLSLKDVNVLNLDSFLSASFINNFSSPFYKCENLYINGERASEIVIPENGTITMYKFCYLKAVDKITVAANIDEVERWAFYQTGDDVIVEFLGKKEDYTLRIDYDYGFTGTMIFG